MKPRPAFKRSLVDKLVSVFANEKPHWHPRHDQLSATYLWLLLYHSLRFESSVVGFQLPCYGREERTLRGWMISGSSIPIYDHQFSAAARSGFLLPLLLAALWLTSLSYSYHEGSCCWHSLS
ncbi:Uncharacterized protein HZ326_18509 [Fusarium oxysporum f. sp. albedinis]|nr:Uncharacterized protein HZ326_18509 [Fusarium oxysporum f. sp. albedinis]